MVEIDPELGEAANEGYSARALNYVVLLDASPPVRSSQLTTLEQHAEPEVYRYTTRFAIRLAALDPRARLPLVGLALPALKQLSDTQYSTFKSGLEIGRASCRERVCQFG